MHQLKSSYNRSFKDLYSHLIHTSFAMIVSNVIIYVFEEDFFVLLFLSAMFKNSNIPLFFQMYITESGQLQRCRIIC